MKYVYLGGPYFSRRLGVSLGINILEDYKICTFDCKYCEIGKTPKQFHVPISYKLLKERDFGEFQREIEDMLEEYPGIDSITFGYYGEPTLAQDLFEMVCFTREIKKKVVGNQETPYISIFTNSSTILFEDVKKLLKAFDQIIFKLDCITQDDFDYFNQPHSSTPTLLDIIGGIRTFTKELRESQSMSKIIIQTLFMKDIKMAKSNYSANKIIEFCNVLNSIKPKEVHFYTVSRTPAYSEIKPITLEDKMKIKEIVQKYLSKDILVKIL